MVYVEYKDGKGNYFDNKLYSTLIKIKKSLNKDDDFVLLIDGPERAGKSVHAQQIARFIDPTFTHERMCFTVEEFTKAIDTSSKGQCVVFDEAYRGLSSEGWNNKIAVLLRAKMMEMGQKNLFIIIVAPNFFLLHKYIVLHRSRAFIHIYRKGEKRGFFAFFNTKRKLTLYLAGKKTMSYTGWKLPRALFFGRFTNQYVIDEIAYRKKKLDSYHDFGAETVKAPKVNANVQRDTYILSLHKEKGMDYYEIEKHLAGSPFAISYATIRRIILSARGHEHSIVEEQKEEVNELIDEDIEEDLPSTKKTYRVLK